MKVSIIWSIYDRRAYVLRALSYLERQTLDKKLWEVVIVDDNSPGNYAEDLKPWRGRLNIQYIKIDSSEHPVIKALNPDGKPLISPIDKPLKFHTPALTHNIGFKLARGNTLFITQPDVLHKEDNLKIAMEKESYKSFRFGKVWMSDQRFAQKIMTSSLDGIKHFDYKTLQNYPGAQAFSFRPSEHYWFVSALSKHAANVVRGVEEDYLGGVFAEDDQFRERVKLAGWTPQNDYQMEGIHIDHSHLTGRHHRSSPRWNFGANRNRSMWVEWMRKPDRQAVGNVNREWGSLEFVKVHEIWDM